MFRFRQLGLRQKFYLGVIFPLFIGMLLIFIFHIRRERILVEEQAFQAAAQIGDIVNSSLQHSMLSHNNEMIDSILSDTSKSDGVLRIQIVDKDGVVTSDAGSDQSDVGRNRSVFDDGCIECLAICPWAR